jgi:hypothetical protein
MSLFYFFIIAASPVSLTRQPCFRFSTPNHILPNKQGIISSYKPFLAASNYGGMFFKLETELVGQIILSPAEK